MNIFKRLTSGDSASWHDLPWIDSQSHEVLGSDLWTLTYQLRGPSMLTLVAVANGDGWTTSMTTAQSATLLPGTYVWAAYLTIPGARRSIGGGTLIIKADLSQVTTPMDARTVARKALDDCEAALANFNATGGKIKRYAINGRETEFHSLTDLMLVRNFWQRKVNNEAARSAVRNGRSNPRELLVRFQ
jgi:hypothetical protein